MNNITSEQFEEALGRLSPAAKGFITSKEFSDALMEIGKKHFLHVNQIGNLSELIIYTAVGILPISNFSENIVKKVGVPEDTLNLIIYEINQRIFLPLRKEMYERDQILAGTHKETEEKPAEETPEKPKEEETSLNNENSLPIVDTFSQKMTTDYGLAREKVEISNQPNQKETPKPVKDPPRHDPYREPIP